MGHAMCGASVTAPKAAWIVGEHIAVATRQGNSLLLMEQPALGLSSAGAPQPFFQRRGLSALALEGDSTGTSS